jgi:hypothetical protein
MTSQVPVKGTAPDQFAADFQTLEREQKNASNEFYSGLLGSVRQGADVFLDSAYLGLGILVSICGFLGGVLAEVYDWKVNNQSTDRGGTDGALATFICATAAGPIGVFVLANSDPSNWGRCALFAVICGFTWKGILEQARMIGKNISQTPDEQTLKAPEAISKIADSNEKNFADNVDKAVSDMSKIFDLSTGAGGTAEQRLLAKNQSNQIISAIYDQVNKLQSSADLLVTALRGIRDIVVASIPANDLNILEVGIDKIVGLARGTKDNDVKQEGVSCLSQIRDKFGTKLPATKADFISNRINDIGFAAKATASIAKGGSGTTAAKPTGSDGSGSAPHTVANAELSGGTGTDQTAAPFADVQAGQEKAPEGEVEK